jgi:two-component system cell cycle sensor histidine kinase/response regulator CckA
VRAGRARRLALSRPDTKVLFMSGYTDDSVIRHGVGENGTPFLQKPFTPESMARRPRDVLDS